MPRLKGDRSWREDSATSSLPTSYQLVAKVPEICPTRFPPKAVEHESISAPPKPNAAAAWTPKLVRLTPTARQGIQRLENRVGALDAQNGTVVIQKPVPPVSQFGKRVFAVSLRTPSGRIKERDDATLHQGDKGHRTPEKLLDSPRRSKTERAIRVHVVISVPRNSPPCFEHFWSAVRRTQRHFDANRVAILDAWESGRLE